MAACVRLDCELILPFCLQAVILRKKPGVTSDQKKGVTSSPLKKRRPARNRDSWLSEQAALLSPIETIPTLVTQTGKKRTG
jgi:hypothetical protein